MNKDKTLTKHDLLNHAIKQSMGIAHVAFSPSPHLQTITTRDTITNIKELQTDYEERTKIDGGKN